MKKEVEKVAVVKCNSYKQETVDKAIKKVLKLLDFNVKKYKKILIKPNILGAYEEHQNAITTNTSIVKAILKQFKGKKWVGESSFSETEKVMKKTGYSKFKNLIIFEKGELVKIKDNRAKVLKNFYLSKIVKKVDLVVNVPKLKTHSLTKITGAIKNLYGLIPGGMKQKLHRKAIGDKKFSKLLIDIYQNIKPKLNIMDAVIGMEGEGPSAGKPKKVGLIMASRNSVALDIVAAILIGYKPKKIFVIKEAVKRKLYPNFKVKIVGDLKKIPNLKFKKPFMRSKEVIKSFLIMFVKYNPILVNEERCVKCGLCARKCPANAISLKPYPEINKKKCIRCYCCIEVCPKHALYIKETSLRKFIKKMRKKKY